MPDWRSLLDPSLRPQFPEPTPYGPQIPDAYAALSAFKPRLQAQAPALAQILAQTSQAPQAGQEAPQTTRQPVQPQQSTGRTVLVGDSLGVGTSPYLGGIKSDAVVGRSSASGVQALRQFARGGDVGRVLFDLGTNDASASQLAASIRQAQHIAPDATLYVPTVNGPDADHKNALLRHLAQDGRITLIDTSGLATGPDGIHLTATGYRRRAALIRQALR